MDKVKTTIDTMREAAMDELRRNDWHTQPTAKLSLHQVKELMASFGMRVQAGEVGCDWPDCGCCADASCADALPHLEPSPSPDMQEETMSNKVKKLEWRKDWAGDSYDIPVWRADSPCGSRSYSFFAYGYSSHKDVPEEKVLAAKAEKQADYERHILSALEPSPSPDMREVVKALEPFSVIAGEQFARNFNKSDVVCSIKGLQLTFEAFLNARAALRSLTGDKK